MRWRVLTPLRRNREERERALLESKGMPTNHLELTSQARVAEVKVRLTPEEIEHCKRTWALAYWRDQFHNFTLLPAEDQANLPVNRGDRFALHYMISLQEWGNESAYTKVECPPFRPMHRTLTRSLAQIATLTRYDRHALPLLIQLAKELWGVRTRSKIYLHKDVRHAIVNWHWQAVDVCPTPLDSVPLPMSPDGVPLFRQDPTEKERQPLLENGMHLPNLPGLTEY